MSVAWPDVPEAPTPPGGTTREAESGEAPRTLYITLGPDGSVKMGTCAHCVVLEVGRPERAWDAQGDADLDFERETLFALLEDFGVQITEREAFVCP
jgi:hypothetical protein